MLQLLLWPQLKPPMWIRWATSPGPFQTRCSRSGTMQVVRAPALQVQITAAAAVQQQGEVVLGVVVVVRGEGLRRGRHLAREGSVEEEVVCCRVSHLQGR